MQKNNSNPFILDKILNSLEKLGLKDESLLKKKINHPLAFSLYQFHSDSDVQKLVHSIKYDGFKNLGIFAGEILGNELLQNNFNSLKEYDFILPVPLHPSKQRERGYNQSDLISEGLSKVIGIPVKNDIIKRIKNTKSQTKLNINQRQKNVENAFRINKKYYGFLKNQNVILLDDVITTGSTIKEILSVILRANAKNVFVISLAHTQSPEYI
jgi:ComF family protein